MRYYSDWTAETAVGNANKDWKRMATIALKIRENRCNPEWADEQIKTFTGIYKRLLTDPIEEVQKEARKH